MSISGVIAVFNRLTLNHLKLGKVYRGITTNTPLALKVTPILLAEPLKKKKRLDPSVVKAREERKKRKIEKLIRRLEKNAKQLKPIDECEVSLSILDERQMRERHVTISEDVTEQRILLEKKWSGFKQNQLLQDLQMLDKLMFSQQKALDELKKESEELYQAAIQFDESLLPFNSEGPKETPPIEGYEAPDGDYQDISKIY